MPVLDVEALKQNDVERNITAETIQLVQQAQQKRAISTATGLIGYDLAAPAAVIVPIITPLVNSLPRVRGVGVDIHRWKAITTYGWNATGAALPGVLDQNAVAPDLAYTVVQYANIFQSIAAKNTVTIQAGLRGRSLEGDVAARRFAELIYALKITEENWLTYYSDYLWSPPVPLNPTTSATGGSIAAQTYYVSVSAFNANGETFATSAVSPITTIGSTSTISMTYFTQPNATGYNVYVGTVSGTRYKQIAANFATPAAALPSQTTGNLSGSASFTLSTLATSGATVPTANTAICVASNSAYGSVPLTFNGIMALVFGAGNQSYAAVNGAPTSAFTAAGGNAATATLSGGLGTSTMTPQLVQPSRADGKLSYADVRALLLLMFNQARAQPNKCYISPQDNDTFTNILFSATGTRVNIDPTRDGVGHLVAGARVECFLNPTTGSVIDVEVLPFMPQGTLIFGTTVMPYQVPGMDGPPIRVITNSDYMGIPLPPTISNPVNGQMDVIDETLEIAFLGGWGAITGIVAGS